MSEYTPTDEQVARAATHVEDAWGPFHFYRWLDEHDAKVRADEREKCAVMAESDQFSDDRGEPYVAPYNAGRREAAAAMRAVYAKGNPSL